MPKKAIKTGLKTLADRALVPALRYLYNEVVVHPTSQRRAVDELNARTASDCADYLGEHMVRALQFDERELLWDHAIANLSVDGLIAEFGVFNGYSINYFGRKLMGQTIYGFDSFEGLPVDWSGAGLTKHAFDLGGKLPKVGPNVFLIKGWFDKTIPEFMAKNNNLPFALVHIDADIYEAAKIVLEQIKESLVVGTVIIFDEYFGFRGWRFGEHLAWQETVKAKGINYEYIGFSTAGQVSVKIKSI